MSQEVDKYSALVRTLFDIDTKDTLSAEKFRYGANDRKKTIAWILVLLSLGVAGAAAYAIWNKKKEKQ